MNRPHPGAQASSELPPSHADLEEMGTNFIHKKNTSREHDVKPVVEIDSLWRRLRESAILTNEHNAAVEREIKRFTGDQVHFDRMVANAEPFIYHVIDALDKRDMPLFLSLVPMIESTYNPAATSEWKAAGLWQFIPSTGKHFGLKQNEWYDGRRDVDASTEAAMDYLSYLHERFKSWELALAAYNCGEANVANAIKRNRKADKPTDYWSLELPKETKRYIPRLIALQSIINTPENYAINLPELDNEPVLSLIELPGQIQLSKVAEVGGLETKKLKKLNAGFLRSTTAPEGPHHLLVPVAVANKLESDLAQLPVRERIKYHEHTVKNGESLWLIARRYDTRVKVLVSVNELESDRVKPGKLLLIPNTGQKIAQHTPSNKKKTTRKNTSRTAARSKPAGSAVSYKVQEGDSLWLIARRHNIHVKDLLDWNDLNRDTPLKLGQELKILAQKPILKPASVN